MKINPKTLSWVAPTTNIDGTPIDYALNYELGLLEADEIRPLMVIPESLQAGGQYEAPIAGLGLGFGMYSLAIRSFAKDEPERFSEWSNAVEFAISRRIPEPPANFGVA